jgi:hypothetical protein
MGVVDNEVVGTVTVLGMGPLLVPLGTELRQKRRQFELDGFNGSSGA